ncbi:MAG: hypothetical protein U5R06_10095 [candidate division KSB1 bacterium]|nr:hypothetical protein [candidate division KSB1 bacterium]
MMRLIRITIYIAVLTGLILYGYIHIPDITLQMCLQDPDRYDGTTITVGNEATVKNLTHDGFIIKQRGRLIPVNSARVNDLKPGVFINFSAVFHKPGWLQAKEIHIMKQRRLKIWVSVIPVIVVVILFFRHFRFDFKNRQFEKR